MIDDCAGMGKDLVLWQESFDQHIVGNSPQQACLHDRTGRQQGADRQRTDRLKGPAIGRLRFLTPARDGAKGYIDQRLAILWHPARQGF